MKRVFIILMLIFASMFTMSQTLIYNDRYRNSGFYSINGVKFGVTENEALNNINCILLDIKKCGCKKIVSMNFVISFIEEAMVFTLIY